MKRYFVVTLAGYLLLATSAYAGPATPQCSACALAWDPVCATINGQQVELANACLATCQEAITAYTSGRCISSPGRTIRVPRFSLPSSSVSLSDMTIKASTMNAMSDAGYVYVGTFKSLDGPPAALKSGNGLLMVNQTSKQTATQATPLSGFGGRGVAWAPGGHMYYQVRQPTQTATITSAPSYFPGFDPTTSQPAPSSRASLSRGLGGIIGDDDRVPINNLASKYPYSTAIRLNYDKADGNPYICTGSLINKRLILTAGHCVYDLDTETFASNFYLTTPDSGKLTAQVTYMTTYQGYVDGGAAEWDIAYLLLDTDLGSTRGWLGTGWDCDNALQTLNTMGYPSDKQDNGDTNMYATSCVTNGEYNACQNEDLVHNCDTITGQSGSALYVMKSENDPHVRGVLNCFYTSPSNPWNCGAWLRPEIWDLMKEYLDKSN